MITLGFDASTTTVGWAITEDKKAILDMGFIDIKHQTTPKEKTFFVLTQMDKNPYIEKIGKIIVEDSLSGFAGGRTSQQVIIKLAKFNAIFCHMIEEYYEGIELSLVNPNTARKSVFGKARLKGVKAKDYVKQKIEEMYDTKKWCKTTSRGKFDPRNIDSYDALVMSLYD